MASTVKLLGSEVAVSNTASNIGNAKVVRIYNGNAADKVVTVKSGSDVVGTVTLITKEVIYLMKLSQETIEVPAGTSGVKAVSVAYSS
tara:strand:- start:198 stop:461 length:264 start_codon:yes stop_codon:yes gene_type:complete